MRGRFVSIVFAGAILFLAGCGSDQDKLERGIATDREVAAPESESELEMTEAERRAAEDDEEDAKEARLFEESQQ